MTKSEYQAAEKRRDALQDTVQGLLVEMELRFSESPGERFREWWITEGNEQRYFAAKGELERLEARLFLARQEGLEEDACVRKIRIR